MAACLGGIDGLVFTGGIGEGSPVIRERICQGCEWLGVDLDPAANQRGDGCITVRNSAVSAWAIPTNEEPMIARYTVDALKAPAHAPARELEHS
jgi:acetate kinase